MLKLIATLIAALLLALPAPGAALLPHSSGTHVARGSLPAPVAQTPTPPAPAPPTARSVSPQVLAALICLSMISLFSIIGSVALKRRFDSISPDR